MSETLCSLCVSPCFLLHISVGEPSWPYRDVTKPSFCTLVSCRPVVGACLLRASEGACVRRLKAWLFLPDANLLPEWRGTKPGESFRISAHAQPRVSGHTDSKSLAICALIFFFFFFSVGVFGHSWWIDKTENCKLLLFKRTRQRECTLNTSCFYVLAFHGLTAAIATTSCGRTDKSCMNNSQYAISGEV